MSTLRALLLALALLACSKKEEHAAAQVTVAPIPAAEIQRGKDACNAYVAKVCACAEGKPELKDLCSISHALPEAIDVALQTTQGLDVTPVDQFRVQDALRKAVKSCIEQTAKLPTLGCAP